MATASKEVTVKIIADCDPENPRDWDSLGIMVCAHRRYTTMGDTHGKDEALKVIHRYLSDKQLDDLNFDPDCIPSIEAALEKTGQVIMLPIYMYEHSGIALQTHPFGCRWDSGKLGFIFVTKEKARSEYGWKLINASRREQILKYLEGEVETYHQFVSGDVWGFEISLDDEVLDSCWGFYGDDPMTNGILDHLSAEAQQVVRSGTYSICY